MPRDAVVDVEGLRTEWKDLHYKALRTSAYDWHFRPQHPAPRGSFVITSSPAVRRTSAVGLALAACLGAVPTAAAAPAPTMSKSEARLDHYYDQRLGWGSCAKSSGDTMGRDLDKAGV